MPAMIHIRNAPIASQNVTGADRAISDSTSSWRLNEYPRHGALHSIGWGESAENVRPKKIPVTNFSYWTRIGSSYPSRCRFASMICGLQALPQVRRAGSPGSRLNRKKTVMVRRNRSTNIPSTRRIR